VLQRCFPAGRHHPPPPLFPYTTLFRSRHRLRLDLRRRARLAARRASAPLLGGHWLGTIPSTRALCQLRYGEVSPCVRPDRCPARSEEHTSELQSQSNLVCRLLLEKTNA